MSNRLALGNCQSLFLLTKNICVTVLDMCPPTVAKSLKLTKLFIHSFSFFYKTRKKVKRVILQTGDGLHMIRVDVKKGVGGGG